MKGKGSNWYSISFPPFDNVGYYYSSKVDNLNCTYNWESGEKSHGSTNSWQHVYKLCCSVLSDSVKCWRVKEYSHKPELIFPVITCSNELVIWNLKMCCKKEKVTGGRGVKPIPHFFWSKEVFKMNFLSRFKPFSTMYFASYFYPHFSGGGGV